MIPSSAHTTCAFLHLPGFGPKKTETLRATGIRTWHDLIASHSHDLPGLSDNVPAWITAARACEDAFARRDLRFLVESLHRSDHWRVLADFLDEAAFLDIETSGDQLMPEITTIICKHRGRLHIYTSGRNLDGFLDLLDHARLFVTFNGASFDIPQLERHFHIPLRDTAHIDLRWVCYHMGLKGGLKEIERAIGLIRPPDLIGMDGAEADWLWRRWKETGNGKLVDRLVRYCAADVIGLEHLSAWLIARETAGPPPSFEWHGLPEAERAETAMPTMPRFETIQRDPEVDAAAERLRRRMRMMRRDELG